MGSFLTRQPNGLYCRHSTVVDCVTDYNMTEEDYIEMCKERAVREARDVIKNHLQSFSMIKDCFIPNNMTEKDFSSVLAEMELPANQCTHKKTQHTC